MAKQGVGRSTLASYRFRDIVEITRYAGQSIRLSPFREQHGNDQTTLGLYSSISHKLKRHAQPNPSYALLLETPAVKYIPARLVIRGVFRQRPLTHVLRGTNRSYRR